MTMLTKTTDDILKLTSDYHQALASSLDEGAYQVPDERCGLLLNYLANQESKLCSTIKNLRRDMKENELRTWFYEYSDRHAIIHSDPRDIHFSTMNPEDIQASISDIHNSLIDLYQHMYERSENNTIKQSMGNIVDMYQSATNRINFHTEAANEL
ncbi:hypothetical protein TDB9533_00465 [Thalassocella blandensis]|nr:hypothetical protein TDB9533_00465 [Thalassocella blandensis]